jgi:hypothetical protein
MVAPALIHQDNRTFDVGRSHVLIDETPHWFEACVLAELLQGVSYCRMNVISLSIERSSFTTAPAAAGE